MNPEEYANLDRVEQSHWYYSGKRDLVRRWIDRVKPPVAGDTLLDCGAGTGRFALEMTGRCRVLVLDDHEESLRMLRERFPADCVLSLGNDGNVPLHDESIDYLTALDVLEHTRDDVAVVKGFRRLLKPGGVAVVTVPACMSLWSDWDVGLHHFRRYDRAGLLALFPGENWDVVHVNYTNVVVFPAVWAMRRWRRWFPATGEGARAEDKVPPSPLNALLRWVFTGMAMIKMPFPFGVSLVLVARRR